MSAAAWMDAAVKARCQPACLVLDKEFKVLESHGELSHYALDLAPGDCAAETLPVLYGLDPAEAMQMDFISLGNGAVADLELKPSPEGCQVLLLDAQQRHDEVQDTQQQHHEIDMLHRQLQRTSEKLQLALTEAQRANEAKSRFIASMSHEFRTPLTSIMGYADRLLRAHAGSTEAAAVRRASRYLVTLVDNLLEQGRINAAEILIQPQASALRDLADDLRDMFEPLAERRGLELRIRLAEDLPEWVEIDDTRVRQIAVNLLGNACKFTQQGYVEFAMHWSRDRLHFAVSDSGPGISAENMQRVFTAFERVSEDAPGVGLGLAISKQLAERMGGSLSLQSELGKGSCFSLDIQAPACDSPESTTPVEAMDILLAEDDDALAMLYTVVLEDEGHRIHRAASVDEAISLSRRTQPNCVITDLNLGECSGLDLIKRIRQTGFSGRIVTLTGSSSAQDREMALHAGADYFLCKPVDLARLSRLLQ